MSCYNRMKRTFLQGLLWLYLLGFGYMALSLEPGFLDFDNLPDTNFTCVGKVIGGYYADLETNCQMFHVCTIGQMDEPMDIRFLCLNGTVFDQETRVCERIDEVDCTKSEQFYSLNLELYGNSQPSIVEENPETDQPLIIKSTTTTKSPTTQTAKTTRRPYYTTSSVPTATTARGVVAAQTINSHHFPLINRNSPDIRFNPEEINISLHPGAPPDIRTNNAYQHHDFSDKQVSSVNDRVVVSTDKVQSESTSKAQVGYNRPTPSDINFSFTYRHAESAEVFTDSPREQDFHQYHREYRPSQKYLEPVHNQPFKSSTFRNEYTHTTPHHDSYQQHPQTTLRNFYIQSLKPPALNQQSQYSQLRTERPPQRLQLPLPLLPTLPTLTFSTPTPFALQHHVETKRYTKDHFPPPRIVISASASVSDATGRRLNYSLGTIGAAQILQQPPTSYDEYKEEHVGLDPFYHDVPKIKRSKRRKRSANQKIKHSDIIQNEQQAVDVLKFLFDWYKNEQTNPARTTTPLSSPLSSATITEINRELSPVQLTKEYETPQDALDINLKTSELFNKNSQYSIIGTENIPAYHQEIAKTINNYKEPVPENTDEVFRHEKDYVDDNYEPNNYDEKYVLEKKEIGSNNKIKKESEAQFTNSRKENPEDRKNYTVPLDYVDDNIEPIYYSERSKIDVASTILPKIKYHIDKHQLNTEEIVITEITTEKQQTQETDYPSVQLVTLNPPGDSITENDSLNIDVQKQFSSTESSISTTTEANENIIRSRNDRRKGNRRRHHNNSSESNTKDIDFKNILIEKLIERPYRAKDDYDYLRTVSNVMSSTTKSDNSEIDDPVSRNLANENDILTNVNKLYEVNEDSSVDFTNESTDLITSSDFTTIISSISTTSEKPKHRNNRRRGRQKYNTYNLNKVSHRTRRPVHQEYKSEQVTIPEDTIKASTNELLNDYKGITKYATYLNTATQPTLFNSRSDSNFNLDPQIDDKEVTKYATYLNTITQPTIVETNSQAGVYSNISEATTTRDWSHSNESEVPVVDTTDNTQDLVVTPSYPPTESILDLEEIFSSAKIEITENLDYNSENAHSKENNTPSLTLTTEVGLQFKKQEIEDNTVPTEKSNNYKTEVETTTENISTIIDEIETTLRSTMVGISREVGRTDKYEMENFETTQTIATTQTPIWKENAFTRHYNEDNIKKYNSQKKTIKNDILEGGITTNVESTTENRQNIYHQDKGYTEDIIQSTNINIENTTPDSIAVTQQDTTVDEEEKYFTNYNQATASSPMYLDKEDITQSTDDAITEAHITNYIKQQHLTPTESTMNTETDSIADVRQQEITESITDINEEEIPPSTDNATKEQTPTSTDNANIETYITKYMQQLTTESTMVASKDDIEQITDDAIKETYITNYVKQQHPTETTTEVNNRDIGTGGTGNDYKTTVNDEDVTVYSTKFDQTTIEYSHVSSKLSQTKENDTSTSEVVTKEIETTTNTEITEIPPWSVATTANMLDSDEVNHVIYTTTTEKPTTRRRGRKNSRPTKRRTNYQRYRHRFNTEQFTKRPDNQKQTIEDEIIDILTRQSKESSTEPIKRKRIEKIRRKPIAENPTDAPLRKNASPTKAERVSHSLPTTPLSRMSVKKHYFFNCFGKPVDKFYADPRDCRLFHYCTQGYTKNQLLDMKFVCDMNTYFDDETLICSKQKPRRCL